jgi:alpha-beta hydrolase superfamily lysophospholipase
MGRRGSRAVARAGRRLTARSSGVIAAVAAALLGCTAPGDRAGPARAWSPGSVPAPAPIPRTVVTRAYALLDAAGDTVSVEQVEEAPGWLEITRTARRRQERHRLVIDRAADGRVTGWDVQVDAPDGPSARRDRWRVYVAADSLRVLRGALIGDPLSLEVIGVRPPVLPWHELSGALLDLAVQRAADAAQLVTSVAPRPVGVPRVARWTGDSVRILLPDQVWEVVVGADGHLDAGHTKDRARRVVRLPSPGDSNPRDLAPSDGLALGEAAPEASLVTLRADDGVRLVGTLLRPRGVTHPPVVLFLSGSGPQDRDLGVPGFAGYRPFAELAEALATRGIASVRLDDRGTGASGGRAFRATRDDEVADARAVLRWIGARADLDGDRLGLVGHSDGGHVALAVASGDARVRTAVLLGTPMQSGRALAAAQRAAVRRASPPQPLSSSARPAGAPQPVPWSPRSADDEPAIARVVAVDAWLRDWLAFDPRAVREPLATAVLLVHGTADRQVPVAQASELAAWLTQRGAKPVQVAIVPAVNHLLLAEPLRDGRHLAPAVSDALLPWLEAHLRTTVHMRPVPDRSAPRENDQSP